MLKPTILVIDDDSAVRALISTILSDEGYAVDECDRGVSPQQIYGSRPALVILDFPAIAPQPTLEVLSQLQLRAGAKPTPVIMTSTTPRLAHHHTRMHHGVSAILEKPFLIEDLTQCVADALQETHCLAAGY